MDPIELFSERQVARRLQITPAEVRLRARAFGIPLVAGGYLTRAGSDRLWWEKIRRS